MRTRRLAIFLIVIFCCGCTRPAEVIDGGRYGQVKVVEPEYQARGFVIFFSSKDGLTPADDADAESIAEAGALVVEVNTPAYLSDLDKVNQKCHSLVGDAEGLSRQLQRKRGFRNYFTPIVMGVGEGGTLAAMVLAQAPAATIAGAVSLNPSVTIASRRPICSTASVEPGAGGFSYGAATSLPGFWIIGVTSDRPQASRDYVSALRRAGAPFELRQIAADQSLGDALYTLIDSHLAKPPAEATTISTLPLTILGVDHPSGIMAIVISGDGGWRDLDKTIGESLQRKGIPVVGWDSLRYFWSLKTPRETADALADVMQTFMARWHASKVALIGYSFGADVMPFAYNRLPEKLRSHIALIALLGFANEADFEITVNGWLREVPGPKAVPILPEMQTIPPSLMICFYGETEEDTACPELAKRGVEVIRTAGGHHFDHNFEALADRIVVDLDRRMATSSPMVKP